MKIKAADLFCGAGGTSSGLLLACKQLRREVDLLAINHWNIAIDSHTRNHPGARHLCESLDNVDPRKLIPGGKLDLLCASPECTHHSIARGGKPRSDQSRATAWHICRWAEALRIENILIENVREFQNWGPLTKRGKPMRSHRGKTYAAFIAALRSLGYQVEDRVLNAADYGDATSRQRLFIMARRTGRVTWPKASHTGQWRAAREIIDWGIAGKSIFNRTRPLKENTLKRIEAGLRKFGGHAFIIKLRGTSVGHINPSATSIDEPLPTLTAGGTHVGLAQPFLMHITHRGGDSNRTHSIERPVPTITGAHRGEIALIHPFLVKYYGSGIAKTVDQPLDTITAQDRFGLVQPKCGDDNLDITFRMLQPKELSAAMSFPSGYQFTGTRESQIKQIGNAVPVRTAAALCKSLLRDK